MKGANYEKLALELVRGIQSGTSLAKCSLGHSAGNRVLGQSGYRHQIDLSVSDDRRLFLFELKCWSGKVGVAEVLVLNSRLRDISQSNPEQSVTASLVSKVGVTRDARKLADHFGINVEIVQDIHSYGLSFGNEHFVGMMSRGSASSILDAEIIKKSKA